VTCGVLAPAPASAAYDHGAGVIHHTGMYIGDGYEIDAPANSATEESPLEIVKVDEHRYADQYARGPLLAEARPIRVIRRNAVCARSQGGRPGLRPGRTPSWAGRVAIR
jgi:hypothetical protein